MLKRIITAAVALAVFIAVLLLPPIVFTVCLAAVTAMMLYECYSATGADAGMRVVGFISAAITVAAFAGYSLMPSEKTIFASLLALVFLLNMALVIFKHGKRGYKDVLSNGFITLYITASMFSIWTIKEASGTSIMLIIFIAAWTTDTFAYFCGRAFGRHKLIPNVSPNKTVEGSVGGVLGAAVCCTAYLFILNAMGIKSASAGCIILSGVILGLTGGVFSQFGDLAASAIKRDTGIKDFGWIFPGHGGFMDRFDSVLYIAPLFVILAVSLPWVL